MAPRSNTRNIILQKVDDLVDVLAKIKELEKKEKETKDFFKGLGIGIYNGTDESIEVKEVDGGTRLNEEKLFLQLTDELGLSSKKANAVIADSKITSKPTMKISVVKKDKKS